MYVEKVILMTSIILAIFLIHSVIPTYYNKKLNKRALKKSSTNNRIILSFDDGPEEEYIYDLLKVLRVNNVKAIFFMVAKKAQQHPEIVRLIEKEGHMIGLHSLEHRNAMLYSYFYTKKDFSESIRIMRKIGVEPEYYRPPWGHTNIFSNYFIKKHGLKLMLWDVMAEDWQIESEPKLITERLLKITTPTSIICLHDGGKNTGGDEGAVRNTVRALETSIPLLRKRGYEFIIPKNSSVTSKYNRPTRVEADAQMIYNSANAV